MAAASSKEVASSGSKESRYLHPDVSRKFKSLASLDASE